MLMVQKGRWCARLAETPQDLRAAQALRWRCFGCAAGAGASAQLDTDELDCVYSHMMIEEFCTGHLAGCFRFRDFASGAEIGSSYSAQFYDLTALESYPAPIFEVGRFCIDPDSFDPDILRVAWAALTGQVDQLGAQLLIGCSSFPGVDAARHAEAFALLRDRHIAPSQWRPLAKAPEIVPFAPFAEGFGRNAMAAMPPLLRTYLLMGGWVSDHAVVDRQLNTMHVFTGLEVRRIPAARARALRALAS